ncbi:MAG: 5'/3'-nucleotidase SurE [Deltaproteobacteria bacterium RIFOXYA12_FULL_58_15]|nr:MAG: 5'/3'-nucleotidase SurE [Deltaproteobacteria bacterium RIFOXYA12_FULL_58_15]OGR15094.1 MAG: 5'/3'-nucleotidase SurE [Deltaproteobacteria bacterium RIFOXYB12_FULL_58_9]
MRLKILLSNDDGVDAPGLNALADRLEDLGEVWVVAPDRERSAASHAISLHRPLRIEQLGARRFSVDGTPCDCVYVGLHHLMDGDPAVVVGGINHGANLGNDVLYSGTLAAAMEGALFGFPAVAVSSATSDRDGDFSLAAEIGAKVIASVLERPMHPGVLLNVNVPKGPPGEIPGIKLCRLGYTDWADAVGVRHDPRDKPYYWIGGERAGHDAIVDSDINAHNQGYITVTPIHYDLTDYRSFAFVRDLRIDGYQNIPDTLGNGPLDYPTVRQRKS